MSLSRLQSLLFLAFALGAVFFTASTLYSELRARSIDADVAATANNGLPSMDLLVGVAIDVDAAEVASAAYFARPDPVRLRDAITSARSGTFDKLQSYMALPAYPGEAALQLELAEAVRGFDASAMALLAVVDAGVADSAQLLERRQLDSSASRVGALTHRLIALNNSHVTASTKRVSSSAPRPREMR